MLQIFQTKYYKFKSDISWPCPINLGWNKDFHINCTKIRKILMEKGLFDGKSNLIINYCWMKSHLLFFYVWLLRNLLFLILLFSSLLFIRIILSCWCLIISFSSSIFIIFSVILLSIASFSSVSLLISSEIAKAVDMC